MPIYDLGNNEVDFAAKSAMTQAASNNESRAFATQYMNGGIRTPGVSMLMTAVGTPIDLVDTIASSILPGVERGSLNNAMLGAIGSPGLSGWYEENKGAIEVGSGIVGVIGSVLVADRILKPTSAAMRLARNVPWIKNVAALDSQYKSALRVAQLTSRETARRGAVGVERFLGPEIKLAALGRTPLVVNPGRAASNLRKAQLMKGVALNATTEVIMAATLRTNSMLYTDDLSHNLAWSAGGLVLGAGIDNLIASYTLRRIANSSTTRRLNAAAYDPSGKEMERLNSASIADAIATITGKTTDESSYLFGGSGAITDSITSEMVQVKELRKQRGFTERAMSLFQKRDAIATPIEKMAFESLNKVTVRGLRGVKRAGFGTKLEGLGAPLKEALDREPAFLYGIEEIGTEVDNLGRRGTAELRNDGITNRLNEVEELLLNDGKMLRKRRKDKNGKEYFVDEFVPLSDEARELLQAESRELHFAKSHVAVTMLEPGEWAPIAMGDIADGFVPRKVVTESIGGGPDGIKLWARETQSPTEPIIGIRSDGELFLPANAPIERLEIEDMIALYHVGNKMVRDMAQSGTKFVLPQNPNWFQLDLAEQLLKATDNEAMVQWPKGMTRQTAMVESFAQKVDAIQGRKATVIRALEDATDTMVFKNKVYFNLPRLTSYQAGLMHSAEHPFDLLLAGFKNGDEVRNTPYTELLKGIQDSKKIVGLTDDTVDTLDSLQGNSFNFLMDRDGNAIKPIIGFKRPLAPAEWTQDELLIRQATNAMYVRDKLIGPTADPITRTIVQTLSADPAFVEAGRVMELADDQHRSGLPGFGSSAPQTSTGSFINALTSRERRDIDNMTMLAASKLKELQTRITQSIMRDTITNAMGDVITQVNSPRNITSKLALNQFHSFRQGWELAREATQVQLPNGKGWSFVLDHTSELNKKRFKQAYGKDLVKGQQLLNPNGQAIVLDELAFDTLQRMQKVHAATIQMKNTLLRSQGLAELKAVPWYAPPPPTKGKFIEYTFDQQDNVIPGMTLVADTPEQLAKMKADLIASDQWRNGYTLRSRQQVESFMDLWDKAQMDYIAPNVTAIQPKKQNFGRTGGNQINMSAFDEALVTMRDSLISHGDDILEVLFKPQLKSARARSSIARVESAAGSRAAEQHSSIFDRYIQNLTGRSSLSAKDSYIGEAYSWAERRLNGWLASPIASSVADTYQALKDYISTARPGGDRASVERFNKLSRELGQYMPFKSAMELVERETGSRTPKEIADLTNKLSWFEAASRLRWLESMHAVMNIGGMLANTSSVIRALQPMAGETLQDAARRNGSLAMMMSTPNGQQFIVPNTPKLLWQSMKDAWAKVPDEFTEKAIKRGYMDQEVAEFNRQWGAIDSKEGWRGFVFGNEYADPSAAKNIFSKAVAKTAQTGGIDKWLSVLSDKSEAFTRAWGMYAGRRVAQTIGITNVDQQLAFAHEMTNKLIANYDPRNRPEVFQGALGAPIGLFQSYVLNYYQRMFRYIETQNGRAIASQYAAQSAVFGISSVPGWDALNWAFFDQQQAENDDPVDSIYRRFGQVDGDLIMHGVLSNLPKLFGGDGVSLYTRGDTQVRLPIVPTPEFLGGDGTWGQIPVADTLSRLWTGLGLAADQLKQNGGISGNQMAEILSNAITNRPLAGMIETFAANGYDTSPDGQVVAEQRGLLDSVYRVLGVRSMQQQKETELFYMNRNAQEEQNARKEALRTATRAAIRDQRFDEIPGLFAKYVDQGGDPRNYSRWVKDSFKSALDTRGERMLEKALKDKNNSQNAYIGRLLDSQVGIREGDESTEDYGYEAEMNRLIEEGWETQPMQRPEDEDPFAVPEGGL